MNFGYVTVNGVDSNVAGLHAIVDWIVCIIYGITTERNHDHRLSRWFALTL